MPYFIWSGVSRSWRLCQEKEWQSSSKWRRIRGKTFSEPTKNLNLNGAWELLNLVTGWGNGSSPLSWTFITWRSNTWQRLIMALFCYMQFTVLRLPTISRRRNWKIIFFKKHMLQYISAPSLILLVIPDWRSMLSREFWECLNWWMIGLWSAGFCNFYERSSWVCVQTWRCIGFYSTRKATSRPVVPRTRAENGRELLDLCVDWSYLFVAPLKAGWDWESHAQILGKYGQEPNFTPKSS